MCFTFCLKGGIVKLTDVLIKNIELVQEAVLFTVTEGGGTITLSNINISILMVYDTSGGLVNSKSPQADAVKVSLVGVAVDAGLPTVVFDATTGGMVRVMNSSQPVLVQDCSFQNITFECVNISVVW
jgi:hypothetical protein